MAKNPLTSEDQEYIRVFDNQFNPIIETLVRIRQFKLGDYLILHLSGPDGSMHVKQNSYGAPIKYQVVHVNDIEVPFVKKVNKKGTPVGQIYSCAGAEDDSYRDIDQKFEFALDPDYADSILLQDNYDPANLHRSKKEIWKAVTDHNKACKVKTNEIKDVINFFQTVNVGDMLWTSNVSHFLVQGKKTMTPRDFNNKVNFRYRTQVKGTSVTVLTVVDKRGKALDISPDFFWEKALYKERPRTYKELNI